MAGIHIISGPREGDPIELKPQGFVIGRSDLCDLRLTDDLAESSYHARIERLGEQWRIRDLESANGTEVNGQPVQVQTLDDGDLVAVGETRFRFVADASAPAPVVLEPRPAGRHAPVAPVAATDEEVRTIAEVLDLKFKRIQFTPDLMPTDITGTDVLETNRETGEKEFRFVPGPVFCNILLADEINRTPPKTQAALLEAMQEHRVTVGNRTYPIEEPFFVLATQNPIEQEGTYPLPEAQLDRFMFNIWVDYPAEVEEEQIVRATTVDTAVRPQKVLGREQVLRLQDVVRKVPVSDHVVKYAVRLVRATRPALEGAPDFVRQYVSVGAGPRACQYLVLAAKARAVLDGRIHVSCRDVRAAARPVLRHRIFTNFTADSEGVTPLKLIERLLEAVPKPSAKDYEVRPA